MAEVKAFRGWRYNPAAVDPKLVTAPPYDVISPADQDFYYQRHSENVIRLDLGREEPGDGEQHNKYTRAADYLAEWRRRKVLIQEAAPAIYLYRQEFAPPGGDKSARTGLIADVTLAPFAEGIVRPHERTLAKPKADRMQLMRATGFQLSQIFMLYDDPEGLIRPLLMAPPASPPVADLVDPENVRHQVWAVTDRKAIDLVTGFFAPRPIYIADGHHRYETALAYRDERLAAGLPLGEAGTVSTVLVEMDQPGLLVLPTHRLAHSLPGWEQAAFCEALKKYFRLEPFSGDAAALERAIAARPRGYGLVFRDGLFLAALADEPEALAAMPPDRAPAWRRLEVSQLHSLVFGKILGLTEEAQTRQENLQYTRSAAEVAAAVAENRAQFGVLLRPTAVRAVKEVADAGETMPQKSTFFWPKLLTGLVFKEL